ncbi:hypothetical protein PSP6_660009 [Paraburkholderia tropica]|nr:hypothetical protein PSP6_660009 [Paraburkholderia tropica]
MADFARRPRRFVESRGTTILKPTRLLARHLAIGAASASRYLIVREVRNYRRAYRAMIYTHDHRQPA